MKSNACIICRYDVHNDKIMTMKRLIDIISRLPLTTGGITPIRFNWGEAEKCKYGLPDCNKIKEQKYLYKDYTYRLNILLTAFIKYAFDDKTYHEILSRLRGKFPTVYTQFERAYRLEKEKYE